MDILNSSNKKCRKELIFYLSIVVLPIIQFLVFYVFVNLNSFRLALTNYDYDQNKYIFVGLDNITSTVKEIFTNGSVLSLAVKNSLIVYFFNIIIGLPLSLFFAYYIYKKMFLSRFFQVLLFMPSIISAIVLVMDFSFFVERAYPEIMKSLFAIDAKGLLADASTRFRTIIFYSIYMSFGTNVLLYSNAMTKIDDSIVEACHLDGAGTFKEFIFITFPMIFSTFTTFVLVGLAMLFNNQAHLYSFFGQSADYSIYTVGYYIFRNINSGEVTLNDYSHLSAVGIVFSIVIVPITLIVRNLLYKIDPCNGR